MLGDDEPLSELAGVFDGEAVLQGDPDYEQARRVWNGVIDRRPAAVIRCASTDDVRAGIALAREYDLPVAVRGGGHSVAGHGTVDDGLVLDLAALDAVGVDAGAREVTVGGGATWGQVDAVTQRHGLVVPGGVFSRTGVAGLALGGGYGWLRNAFGLSCANLVAAQLVTADSQLLEVSESSHPELLWALRGGGGNVGVVTRFTFRAHPLGPDVYFLMVFHDASGGAGPGLLRRLRDFCATAPDSVSMVGVVGVVPADGEGFPAQAAGRPYVAFAGVFAGDPAEGERLLRPLARAGTPLLDASGVTPWVAVQQVFDADYPDGGRYYWKSTNVTELGDEAVELICRAGGAPPSELSTVDVWHVAGAAARPVDGAFAVSSADFLVNPEANWTDPADDDDNIRWVRDLVAYLAPFSDGTRYLNFAGFHEEETDQVGRSFGGNYERLARVKAQWDPHNVFRVNQNVRPEAAPPDAGYRRGA